MASNGYICLCAYAESFCIPPITPILLTAHHVIHLVVYCCMTGGLCLSSGQPC